MSKSSTAEQRENTSTGDISIDTETMPNGEIRINHSVIASIVRFSALEVNGVAAVGGRFMDGVAEIFSKKESDRGVSVREDEEGRYVIDVRLFLYFGNPLTKLGLKIQQNVVRQVTFMTNKEVAQVNVIIDGVKVHEENRAIETAEE